jgi:broad specificity phosphatase PhoE
MSLPVTSSAWREFDVTPTQQAWMAWWIEMGRFCYPSASAITYLYPSAITEAADLGSPVQNALIIPNGMVVEEFDALYASPLLRAQETAAHLQSALGIEIQIEDGIAEYDRMSEAYIPIEEVKRSDDPEIQAHWKALAEDRLEDLIADAHTFRPRVAEATERLIANHPSQRIVAVCHGGVINVALAIVLGIDRALWFDPHYTSLSRMIASRAGVRSLASLNERAHLDARRDSQ